MTSRKSASLAMYSTNMPRHTHSVPLSPQWPHLHAWTGQPNAHRHCDAAILDNSSREGRSPTRVQSARHSHCKKCKNRSSTCDAHSSKQCNGCAALVPSMYAHNGQLVHKSGVPAPCRCQVPDDVYGLGNRCSLQGLVESIQELLQRFLAGHLSDLGMNPMVAGPMMVARASGCPRPR